MLKIPMLFLQGTRDTLAQLDQLEPLCRELGSRATLKLFQDADHSFHVPARSGRKDAEVRREMLDALTSWIDEVIEAERKRDKTDHADHKPPATNNVKPCRET